MTLASADARDNPIVSPNWLLNPADAELVLQAVKRAREIFAAAGVGVEEVAPGANVTTDEQIMEYVRNSAGPFWHASATCEFALFP